MKVDSSYVLENIPCPICGAFDDKIVIEGAPENYIGLGGAFNVVECQSCGHNYTNPRPTKETIGYFYPDSARYYQPQKFNEKASFSRRLFYLTLKHHYGYKHISLPQIYGFIPRFCTRFLLKRVAQEHIPPFAQDGKVLDVGCSFGYYLSRLKELGWEVQGIEMNTKAAAFAQENLGSAHIHQGILEKSNFPDRHFQCINMSMVLEHTFSPSEFLKEAHRILDDNGKIIISVPNFSGFESRFYKKYANTLHVPQHLQHFRAHQMSHYLESLGFEGVDVFFQHTDRDILIPLQYYDSSVMRLLKKILEVSIFRNTIVFAAVKVLVFFRCSSRMTIKATKRE